MISDNKYRYWLRSHMFFFFSDIEDYNSSGLFDLAISPKFEGKDGNSGYITPLYQENNGLYDYNLMMRWSILVNTDKIVSMNFLYIDIEDGESFQCEYDILVVSLIFIQITTHFLELLNRGKAVDNRSFCLMYMEANCTVAAAFILS